MKVINIGNSNDLRKQNRIGRTLDSIDKARSGGLLRETSARLGDTGAPS